MNTATSSVSPPDVDRHVSRMPARLLVLLVIAVLAATYWPTLVSIEAIWRRSTTFAHGYLVLPLALAVAWLHRRQLAALAPAPFWPGLAVVAIAGAGWLVGSLADVVALEQFSLYAMMIGVIVTVLGLRISRELAFPLAFLVFAVPLGDFLVPMLIDRTADFTLVALQASGVPVLREGNVLTIPSGRWSVVDACSGIRYLMASMMVGALYANLTYRALHKRLWFLLASIIVPIIANWLRAYLIVMLGHLTNNRLATGIDHFIYGWVFFGLVIVLMFWVGSFWRDGEPLAVPAQAPPAGAPTAAIALAAVLAVGAGIIWRPLLAAVEWPPSTVSGPLATIPAARGWRAAAQPSPLWTPHFIGARSELHQWFSRDGETVGVYIALYSGQHQGRELVGYRNQLVEADDKIWKKLAESRQEVRWNGADIGVKAVEIASGPVQLSARSWYWVIDRYTVSDTLAKAWLALARLSRQPDQSAVIVIYTPKTDSGDASTERLNRFSDDMGAAVMQALRAAAAGAGAEAAARQ